MQKVILSLMLLLFPVIGFADNSNITITNMWAAPTIGNVENTAVYLDITNKGTEADTLLSAQTSIATKCELHKTVNTDGIITMTAIDKLVIPGNTVVKFAPNGMHVMLMGLNKKLVLGDHLLLTLTFEKAGTIIVDVPVQANNVK
ncbi:MAG: copper chaperone PCu(A)C [Rickettsiales endosymbiont of Dermacentor nuttalli]